MFQKGCGIGIPADPFRNSGLDDAAVDFWDHNPISNEMSASVHRFAHARVSVGANRPAESLSAPETLRLVTSATLPKLKVIGRPQAARYARTSDTLSAIWGFRLSLAWRRRSCYSDATPWVLQNGGPWC